MARRLEAADLVGSWEIAERLGVSHVETVHLWRRRYPEFPSPVAELHMGFVWSWRDIEAWARRTGRLSAQD